MLFDSLTIQTSCEPIHWKVLTQITISKYIKTELSFFLWWNISLNRPSLSV